MLNGGYFHFSLVIWSIADWFDIFTLYLFITLKPLLLSKLHRWYYAQFMGGILYIWALNLMLKAQ